MRRTGWTKMAEYNRRFVLGLPDGKRRKKRDRSRLGGLLKHYSRKAA